MRDRAPGIPQLLLEAGAHILTKATGTEHPPSIWNGPIAEVKFCYQWLVQQNALTGSHMEDGKSILRSRIEAKDPAFIDFMLDIYTTKFPRIKKKDDPELLLSPSYLSREDVNWLKPHANEVFEAEGWGKPEWS